MKPKVLIGILLLGIISIGLIRYLSQGLDNTASIANSNDLSAALTEQLTEVDNNKAISAQQKSTASVPTTPSAPFQTTLESTETHATSQAKPNKKPALSPPLESDLLAINPDQFGNQIPADQLPPEELIEIGEYIPVDEAGMRAAEKEYLENKDHYENLAANSEPQFPEPVAVENPELQGDSIIPEAGEAISIGEFIPLDEGGLDIGDNALATRAQDNPSVIEVGEFIPIELPEPQAADPEQ